MPPKKLAPLVDSEFDVDWPSPSHPTFDVDYDFAIKHDLIQSDDGVMDFHAMSKSF